MAANPHSLDHAAAPVAAGDLSQLISSIGEPAFEPRLMDYLHHLCGAEHCSIFQLGSAEEPVQFTAVSLDGTDTARRQASIYIGREWWRRDPAFREAQRGLDAPRPSLVRLDVRTLEDLELRDILYGRTHIRDRLLVCGASAGMAFGVSILRSDRRGPFDAGQIEELGGVSGTLLSLIAKNAGVRWQKSSLASALTSLAEIEACLLKAPQQFPRREAEVCARILYGMTSLGIALDLGIGEETVMTYRKRAYQRLQLGSHRELLLWYLALWSSLPAQAARSAAVRVERHDA
jgi:DNA-binding CsgD family transcriptional regulator